MRRNLSKILTIPIASLIISRDSQNIDFTHFRSNPQTDSLFSRLFPSQNPLSFADWHWNWNWNLTTPKKLIEQAFDSAKSVEEMLELYRDYEASHDPNDTDLGVACAKIAFVLNIEDKDPELILNFGKKASDILFNYENQFCNLDSFDENYWRLHVIVMRNLLYLGIACSKLGMHDESLEYLNRAKKVGVSLESCDDAAVLWDLCGIESYLASGKVAKGVADEDIVRHLSKFVDILERFEWEYFLNLGYACKLVGLGYFRLFEFEEALPYCLKALKILTRHFGDDSLEVAEVRGLLGAIYGSLGEYEKGIGQLQIATGTLRKFDPSSDELVENEIRSAKYRILLGWYEEGVDTLSVIVSREIKIKELRAMAFVYMAEGYFYQGRFADARRCAKIAGDTCGEKDDQESEPGYLADIFMELSAVYEKMNEPEIAMSYLQMLMTTVKLPLKILSFVTVKYFTLICVTGKATDGIPYLEIAVQRLKERYGSKHSQVGKVYWYLGYAYLMLHKPETAVKFLIESKDIMDATVGPHHEISIVACQDLVRAYAEMGSYSEAIDIQETVVERLKRKEPRAQDEVDAAVTLLEDIKRKAGR